MSKFWIDFQGYCCVNANSKEEFSGTILPLQIILYMISIIKLILSKRKRLAKANPLFYILDV